MNKKKKLKYMNKRELMKAHCSLLGKYGKARKLIYQQRTQICLMRMRMQKVRDIIEFILKHPWSLKTCGYETEKEKFARKKKEE